MLSTTFGRWDLGENMSKRAKRRKAEALAMPLPARVAIGNVAIALVGNSLLSRSISVQPMPKSSVQQAQASSAPINVSTSSRPAAATISVQAAAVLIDLPKPTEGSGPLARQLVDYASHQTPGTVIIDTGNTFLYLVLNSRQAMG